MKKVHRHLYWSGLLALILVLVLLIAQAPTDQFESAAAQTPAACGGLVGYWTFDDAADIAKDHVGSHDGIVFEGGNTQDNWLAHGIVNGAFRFDGDDYIQLEAAGPAQNLNIPAWESYTISLWFNHDANVAPTGYGSKILDKTTWYSDFWLDVYPSDHALRFKQYQSDHSPDLSTAPLGLDYVDGQWHHAVVTVEGNSTVRARSLFVDGALVMSDNGSRFVTNSQPLLLGYSQSGDHHQRKYWPGNMDEVAIFNRALTSGEAIALYNVSNDGFGYCTLAVDVDIKPGSEPNCINNNAHGVIPVAILSTDNFDATTVEPHSVQLDAMTVKIKGNSGKAGALEDVDGDGDLDLVVQIEDAEDIYVEGETVGTVTGLTKSGQPFYGKDTICTVP